MLEYFVAFIDSCNAWNPLHPAMHLSASITYTCTAVPHSLSPGLDGLAGREEVEVLAEHHQASGAPASATLDVGVFWL